MSKNEKKNKHMTLDDRIEIQECLAKGMTFKSIGKRINKHPTSISREVKMHAQTHKSGFTKTDSICTTLLKAPFVCNGCDKKAKAAVRIPDDFILLKQRRKFMKSYALKQGAGSH